MTIAEWLDANGRDAPPALASRVRELLGADAKRDAADATEVLLACAERALGDVIAQATSRAQAFDLLAVDALTTYALEAAARDPERLASIAIPAMQRFAALGERVA